MQIRESPVDFHRRFAFGEPVWPRERGSFPLPLPPSHALPLLSSTLSQLHTAVSSGGVGMIRSTVQVGLLLSADGACRGRKWQHDHNAVPLFRRRPSVDNHHTASTGALSSPPPVVSVGLGTLAITLCPGMR